MKILFATRRNFLPQLVGGSEWSTHFLCRGLQKSGNSVGLVCNLSNRGWIALQNRLKRRLGLGQFPADHGLGYPVYRGWNIEAGLPEAARTMNADTIVIVGAPPDPVGLAKVAIRTGCRVFYQIRDVEFDRHGDELGSLNSVTFISNSEFTRSRLLDRFGFDSSIVRPPVFPEHCKASTIGKRATLINPDPLKGGEIAVTMAERRPNIPFLIQESWLGNAKLVALRERALKAGNIVWRAPVRDVRQIYAETRVLLAPSQWEETWGRVATEAHINGIPVLGSDRGGLAEAIGPGGICLPYDAPIDDWLAALDQMWNDPDCWSTLSLRAREYSMRPEIDPSHQVEQFRTILAA